MKSISLNLSKSLYLAAMLLLLSSVPANAQEDFPEDVNDEPSVPIDGFIVSGLIAGSVIGLRKLKKDVL